MGQADFFIRLLEYPYALSLLIIPYTIIGVKYLPTNLTVSACIHESTVFTDFNSINSGEFVPFAFVFGLLATIFALLDPFGRIIRKFKKWKLFTSKYNTNYQNSILGYNVKEYDEKENTVPIETLNNIKTYYLHHAINEKNVVFEIDKVVGILYLISVVITLSWFFSMNTTHLCFMYHHTHIENIWGPSHFALKWWFPIIIALPVIVLLIYAFISEFKKLDKKIRTAAIYLMAAEKQSESERSVEKMEDFIERKGWEVAEQWSHNYVTTFVKKPHNEEKTKSKTAVN